MGTGPVLILAAALLWSVGGLGIKWLKESAAPDALAIAGWRSLFAIPLLVVGAGRGWGAVRPGTAFGVTAATYAATLICLVAATTRTTAANAILLQYTAPLWLMLAGLLMPGADRIGRRDVLLGAACLTGLGLFFGDRLSPEGMTGNVLAVVSGASFAAMTLSLRRQMAGVGGAAAPDPLPAVAAGNALVSLCCLPWMAADVGKFGPVHWAVIAGLGTLQIGLPYLLFTRAVRHVAPVRATLIAMVEPILNPVWVALFAAEVPGPWAMAGGAVLLSALAVDAVVPRAVTPKVAPPTPAEPLPAAAAVIPPVRPAPGAAARLPPP